MAYEPNVGFGDLPKLPPEPPSIANIKESFRWMTPEFKTIDVTGKKVKIKGVALRSGEVSKNKRKYIEKELMKGARTAKGKPVTINHDSSTIVGNIEWMEFDESDGKLEYVAQISKEPYLTMLRERDPSLQGVSIEGNYLYMKCPQCPEHFFSEREFADHMLLEHAVKVPVQEVHGLYLTALSLVVSPEEPGVPGTTIELMETVQPRIFDAIMKDKLKESDRMEQAPMGIASDGKIYSRYKARTRKILEQIFGKRLGEPFAGYDNLEDCVAKNGEKEDPEAYCATMMRNEEVNELTELRKKTSFGGRSIKEMDAAFVEYKRTMNEQVLANLEPVKAGFESLEKRMVLAETRLNNLTSDQLVTYLKETKEDHEQERQAEQWKTNVQTKLGNLEEKLTKLSVFKGQVKNEAPKSGFKGKDPLKKS